MKLSAIFKTSFHQLSASWYRTLTQFLLIAIALTLPLAVYVFSENFQSIAKSLKTTNQLTLYLSKDNTPAQNNDLLDALKSNPMIEHCRYISPDEGFKELQAEGQFENVLTELPQNPLPATIVVQLAPSVQTIDQANPLLAQFKQWPGVAHATMDLVWLQRLNALLSLGHRIHIALLLFFSAAAILIIGYTMRLDKNDYQQGIELLKTFGAETNSIPWSFLLNGIISGLMGSLLAWLTADGFILWIRGPFMELSRLYGNTFELQGLTLPPTIILFLSGTILSLAGAWISVHHPIGLYQKKETPV